MNSPRLLLCVALASLFATQTIACRKRNKPNAEPVAPSEAPAAPPTAAAQEQPPANLPTGAGTQLAPSGAGADPGKEAVKTQDRFNRNSLWMAKLGKNDPQLRAQVLAEIQKAGLSPAEMQELRKQAQLYGIKL